MATVDNDANNGRSTDGNNENNNDSGMDNGSDMIMEMEATAENNGDSGTPDKWRINTTEKDAIEVWIVEKLSKEKE